MSNMTITEIKQEMEALKMSLKTRIEEFANANPGLEFNIKIQKDEMFVISERDPSCRYIPKIKVILK